MLRPPGSCQHRRWRQCMRRAPACSRTCLAIATVEGLAEAVGVCNLARGSTAPRPLAFASVRVGRGHVAVLEASDAGTVGALRAIACRRRRRRGGGADVAARTTVGDRYSSAHKCHSRRSPRPRHSRRPSRSPLSSRSRSRSDCRRCSLCPPPRRRPTASAHRQEPSAELRLRLLRRKTESTHRDTPPRGVRRS